MNDSDARGYSHVPVMVFMTTVGPMLGASVRRLRHQFHRVDRDMRPADEPRGGSPDREEIQQHALRLLQHELWIALRIGPSSSSIQNTARIWHGVRPLDQERNVGDAAGG